MNVAHAALVVLPVVLVAIVAALALGWLACRAGWSTRSVRHTLWTGAAVAAVLLVCQALIVSSVVAGGLGGLSVDDGAVLRWFVVHRDPFATGLAIVLAALGGAAAMTVLAVVTVLVLGYLRHWEQAVVVAVTAVGAWLLVIGLKTFYGRPRPPRFQQVIHYHGHSLPSGHALGATVVVGVVAAVTYPVLSGSRGRAALVVGVAAMVLLVGVSRLYLAAHWLTDVLTGWLLGGAWLAVGVTALALLAARGGPVADAAVQSTRSDLAGQ
jgi:membrane-associated phospholipid phosphatase